MSERDDPELTALTAALLATYRQDPRAQHIDRRYMPSKAEILDCVQRLLELFYPGYYGRQDLTSANVEAHLRERLAALRAKLERQIELCLCYRDESAPGDQPDVPQCRQHGHEVARDFLAALPMLRQKLVLDVQAAFDGDPAAGTLDEVVLAYPGLLAVTVYRVAHALDQLGVPLMPRIMTEWAHTQTGADIHPSAEIGERFFIDHATGVVIGATSRIGAGVRIYQGVTLGARSLPRGADGRAIRGHKRHPTVEDDVTLYANAIVLGGETVLGRGAIIGGSVFLTKSVPADARVAAEMPQLRIATRPPPPKGEGDDNL